MHRDTGFAPVIFLFVIVLIAMAAAQCDVRYASAAQRSSTTDIGGTR